MSSLSPSNSIGRVRISIPDEIASSLYLNLDEPSTTKPKILVMHKQIVVIDQITRIHDKPSAIEVTDAASYLTRRPSFVPLSIANSKNIGAPIIQTARIERGTNVVERTRMEISQFLSLDIEQASNIGKAVSRIWGA